MIAYSVEFLDMIGDIVALCICGATILVVFAVKKSKDRSIASREARNSSGVPACSWDGSLRMRRPYDGHPESVAHTLGKERPRRGRRNFSDHGEGTGEALRRQNLWDEDEEITEEDSRWAECCVPGGPYREVERLSDAGVDVRGISQRLGIPAGEIELVVNLREKRRIMGSQRGSELIASA